MPNSSRKAKLVIITLTGLLLSPLAISHFDDKQIPQSYRQSWFAMLATNFVRAELFFTDFKEIYKALIRKLTKMQLPKNSYVTQKNSYVTQKNSYVTQK